MFMHYNSDPLQARAKELKIKLLKLETAAEKSIAKLTDHNRLFAEFAQFIRYNVYPLNRLIYQLETGSFVNFVGQKRGCRNPLVFDNANDFANFIENEINLGQSHYFNLCNIYLTESRIDIYHNLSDIRLDETFSEERAQNNKRDSWDDWDCDVSLNERLENRIGNKVVNDVDQFADSEFDAELDYVDDLFNFAEKKSTNKNVTEDTNNLSGVNFHCRRLFDVRELFKNVEKEKKPLTANSNPTDLKKHISLEKKKKKKKIKQVNSIFLNNLPKKRDEDKDDSKKMPLRRSLK